MTVTTNILDVFPDGVITKASFTVPYIISLTISRLYPDEPFTITSCEVVSKEEHQLSEAVAEIRSTMLEHDIDILIPVVNPLLSQD